MTDPDKEERDCEAADARDAFDRGLTALRLFAGDGEPARAGPAEHATSAPPAVAAERDHLSGLGTRRHYAAAIAPMLEGLRAGGDIGIALINLTNLKTVNDRFGYRAGDHCIRALGARVLAHAASPEMVFRLGGDEFILAFCRAPALHGQDPLFATLAQAMAAPLTWRGHEFSVGCSIGVAYGEQRGALQPLRLLERAGIALTTARKSGGGSVGYYAKDMRRAAKREFDVIQKTAAAIGEGRGAVFLQPKVLLRDRSIKGYEALIRLKQQDGVFLTPHAFAEALEDPVTTRKIGRFVLREILTVNEQLSAIGHPAPSIAINLTTADFHGDSAVGDILAMLADGRLAPDRLQVEVTERTLIDARDNQVRTALESLSEAGVKISLDDFGTGYASLIHLRDLVFHKIKIDRSFIEHICTSKADLAIVRATIGLARDLGKLVIAEGIETEEQEEMLIDLGCDMGQGYLYGRPQPALEVLRSETERRFGRF